MPVLVVSPNGAIVVRKDLNTAMQVPGDPTSYLLNIDKKLIIITSDITLTDDVTVPVGVELQITNNAVVTVPTGLVLNILGEFQKPSYDCFNLVGTGSVSIPDGGPGANQNWSIKNLVAAGTASIAGALTGLSAVFSSTVEATGGFTGDLTGNADTATTATDADGTGSAMFCPVDGVMVQYGSNPASPGYQAFTPPFSVSPAVFIQPLTVGANTAKTGLNTVTVNGFNYYTDGTNAICWLAIGPK